ncbi:hypothetical protein CEXT_563911, partial [Caerostris extrusa]
MSEKTPRGNRFLKFANRTDLDITETDLISRT